MKYDAMGRRVTTLEQRLGDRPEGEWRADDMDRWRRAMIAAEDPEGLIAEARSRAVAWERARFGEEAHDALRRG